MTIVAIGDIYIERFIGNIITVVGINNQYGVQRPADLNIQIVWREPGEYVYEFYEYRSRDFERLLRLRQIVPYYFPFGCM